MSKKFNYIYEKLVDDKNDIIGHIAYSIYKQDKIDYITSKKEENLEIKNKILIPFHEISSTASSIEAYKIKAEIVMQAFFENTISEIYSDIEKETKENYTQLIKDTIKPLTSGFWKSFWAGLLSAFIFALVIAAIAFILQFQNSTINVTVDKNKTEKNN
ncbi:hypothetical protein JoomaDRAFT_2270 [Galbibacter orientalis DSM 19592]|uniref:Uncharacterized protein n=1 Tax=Galbibacter orientalis DSM 19592 TaxID=926559 RepID=I3C6L5_9FLAO|nr:hypothetical protein [Galbibacter orientalis]EIJ39258.1 hypothetical protein JoomaDRAFT_2270 [Galbibacter orientalis DSM 19592]